jgi:hypothetical protein
MGDNPAAHLLAQLEALDESEQAPLAFDLLTRIDARWPPGLTERALRVLDHHVHSNATRWSPPRTSLDPWAPRLDPGSAEPLLARLVARVSPEGTWSPAVGRLHELVRLRIDIRKELLT